jgi:hypothetical protein
MIFKYLIPFDRFVIHSRMSVVEAVQALRATVEPRKLFRLSFSREKPFQGEVTGAGFRISRIILYRNAFLPAINGTIEPALNGSLIHIRMGLGPFTTLFSIVWLSGVGLIGSSLLLQVSWRLILAQPLMLMPMGMVAFFLLLANGSFWTEAGKQKKMLAGVFGGTEA